MNEYRYRGQTQVVPHQKSQHNFRLILHVHVRVRSGDACFSICYNNLVVHFQVVRDASPNEF